MNLSAVNLTGHPVVHIVTKDLRQNQIFEIMHKLVYIITIDYWILS